VSAHLPDLLNTIRFFEESAGTYAKVYLLQTLVRMACHQVTDS